MEYLLISGSTYKIYHSFRRLCKDNGIDTSKITPDMLPANTPVGIIVAIQPDTRI